MIKLKTFKCGGRRGDSLDYPSGPNSVVVVKLLSHILCNPWTVAHQAPLSIGFSTEEYWSGLPFPFPGDLLDSGLEPVSPAFAGGFFTIEPPGKPQFSHTGL